MISSILEAYNIDPSQSILEPLSSGLINGTWKVTYRSQQYILQRINRNVFKDPDQLADNLRLLNNYVKEHAPSYLFVASLKTAGGDEMVQSADGEYYRLSPFVKDSRTINVVATPEQGYEAACQFSAFTRLFAGFNASLLAVTIPDFHNLTLRYRQFEEALEQGNPQRIKESAGIIAGIQENLFIVQEYERICSGNKIRSRVTHHDTKISNVLFNANGKGICVIDLDTVMSGYFISDLGDMMRTYLSPVNEEEKDFSKIEVREDFFRAIIQGYLKNLGKEFTDEEYDFIFYAGLFMIYMQAIRFLTDHLKNDVYYGAAYEGHNLIRAINQLTLLNRLKEKEKKLQAIIAEERKKGTHFSIL